jgi:hypothetical protein
MKKQIIIFMLGILLLASLVSAKLEYWQTKENVATNDSSVVNGTMKIHSVVVYDKKNPFGTSLNIMDFISGNNAFQFYFIYDMYVKSWNSNNPSFEISYCNITINYYPHLQNTPITLMSGEFNSESSDVFNVKYYVKLYEEETAIADIFCKLENTSVNTKLDMPSEIRIGTPTQECKACQYYEWVVQEAQITKSQTIGDNTTTIMDYIKKLFVINFEILLAFFWIFLILIVFVTISFIFMGVYWLFVYLRGLAK